MLVPGLSEGAKPPRVKDAEDRVMRRAAAQIARESDPVAVCALMGRAFALRSVAASRAQAIVYELEFARAPTANWQHFQESLRRKGIDWRTGKALTAAR